MSSSLKDKAQVAATWLVVGGLVLSSYLGFAYLRDNGDSRGAYLIVAFAFLVFILLVYLAKERRTPARPEKQTRLLGRRSLALRRLQKRRVQNPWREDPIGLWALLLVICAGILWLLSPWSTPVLDSILPAWGTLGAYVPLFLGLVFVIAAAYVLIPFLPSSVAKAEERAKLDTAVDELIERIRRFLNNQERHLGLEDLGEADRREWAIERKQEIFEQWPSDISEWENLRADLELFAIAVDEGITEEEQRKFLSVWEARLALYNALRFESKLAEREKTHIAINEEIELAHVETAGTLDRAAGREGYKTATQATELGKKAAAKKDDDRDLKVGS